MDVPRAIAECLDLRATTVQYTAVPESKREPIFVSESGNKEVVDEVIKTIITAENGGPLLRSQLKDIISADTWKETVAKAILFNLEQMIQKGPNTRGRALREAIQVADEAVKEIFHFAADHPVICTLIAIGVLVLLAPWLIKALGFGELGPIEGISQSQSLFHSDVSPENRFFLLLRGNQPAKVTCPAEAYFHSFNVWEWYGTEFVIDNIQSREPHLL
ncbi:hypothetical protein TCE0_024r07318 [Talaromyces pinophilus]|jgi:hypothetical protein|uniref:Uncharacterized protein n=1 Tax=Talaromyces pinophilus TaxID=128442 RepID=A0A6V8H7T9_TALPI|nr:hypothetical protein TCE0_024r07318 [Talaromyces pinophilus]